MNNQEMAKDMARVQALAAGASTALPMDDVELMKLGLDDIEREFGERARWPFGMLSFESVIMFYTACRVGAEKCAIELIERGMPFDGPLPSDGSEQTPLGWAARNNKVALVSYVLGRGANMEASDGASFRPLMIAARHGSLAALGLLLRSGAKIEATDQFGRTALGHAIHGGSVGGVLALLEAGASPDAAMGGGEVPLTQNLEDRARMLNCRAAVTSWLDRRDLEARISSARASGSRTSRM